MKKNLFQIVIAGVLSLSLVLALAGCKKNKGEDNGGDPTTCSHTDADANGKCDKCGADYKQDGTDPSVCQHTPGSATRENEVAATCTAEGSYDEVVYCTRAGCGAEISRTRHTTPISHSYNGYSCALCGADRPASTGLEFISLGNGTCYFKGPGTCTDEVFVIPSKSPEGDTVVGLGTPDYDDYAGGMPDISIETGATLVVYSLGGTKRAVYIPDSVQKLKSDALSWTSSSLGSIYIGAGVSEINCNLANCHSLASITVADDNATYKTINGNHLYTKDGTSLISYAAADAATSFAIPDSVTSIEYGAFQYCINLKSITVPESVEHISEGAFMNCHTLIEVINRSELNIALGDSVGGGIADYALVVTTDEPSRLEMRGDFAFYTHGGVNYLVRYSGNAAAVTLPESFDGEGYEIYRYAFYNDAGITSVSIPAAVTHIGDSAFANCSGLNSVALSEGLLSIGDSAFYWTAIEELVIPDSTTTIGDGALGFCWGIRSITIGAGVTSIGDGVLSWFFGTLLEIINRSSLPITAGSTDYGGIAANATEVHSGPTRFETVGNALFYAAEDKNYLYSYADDGSTEIILPDSYHGEGYVLCPGAIPYGPDRYEKITISAGVLEIGTALYEYNFKIIAVDPDNPNYKNIDGNHVYTKDGTTLVQYAGGDGATSFTVPDGVTSIADYAFYGCANLVSVTIPDDVVSIGNAAFYGCTGLTSITIPDSVTSIGDSAFSGCTGLTSVTIGNGVTSIGDSAFYGCTGLTSITIPDGVTSIADYAFYCCANLVSVTIPDGIVSIGNAAFYGCTGLTSIAIPDGVTSIGDSAFSGCTGLTSVTIPDSVTSIGNAAFRGCTELISITIPDGVTSIGDLAFYGCASLASITIPDGVTSIGRSAFYECTALTSVTIGIGVTSIGELAFYNCYELTSITIPDSVTSIGRSAFEGCASLVSITIPDGVTSIGSYAFRDCASLVSVTIPDGVTSIGNSAFYNCTALEEIYFNAVAMNDLSYYNGVFSNAGRNGSGIKVVIGKDVTKIPAYLFNPYYDSSNSPKIVSVEFEEGSVCESIGSYAFYNCTGLTSITIPDSVTSIGELAFYNCYELTSVTFADPYGWYCNGADVGPFDLYDAAYAAYMLSTMGNGWAK